MVVLIDAKYYGAILRRARRNKRINTADAAKIFRISTKEYRRYERGVDPIPEHVLMCLFHRGFCMLQCNNKM